MEDLVSEMFWMKTDSMEEDEMSVVCSDFIIPAAIYPCSAFVVCSLGPLESQFIA